MTNPIFENVKYLFILGITGIILIGLGSFFSLTFLNLFGAGFIGITLLLVIIGFIIQVM